MRFTVSAALAASLTVIASGCGALFNEKERPVYVDSNPRGALVEVRGEQVGRTPLEVTLQTHETHLVTVTHGGRTETCLLEARIEPVWLILDILALGLPIIIDAATGYWNDIPGACLVAFGGRGMPDPRPPGEVEPSPRPEREAPTRDEPPRDPPRDGTTPFPFPK